MMNVTEVIGRYFGYPTCCIKEYDRVLASGGRKSTEQILVQARHNHGFVPCTAHCQQILEGKTTIESLIHDRLCPLPYPEEPDIEVIDEFLTVS